MLKLLLHDEIAAAYTITLPSIVSIFYLYMHFNYKITIAVVGCVLHMPYSINLHINKYNGYSAEIIDKAYKFDLDFIHIHSMITGFSWNLKVNYFEVILHLGCILINHNYLPTSGNDHTAIKFKKWNTYLCIIGIFLSSYEMYNLDKKLYLISAIAWLLSAAVFLEFFKTKYKSAILHILLTIPQYCIVAALS